MSFERVSSPQDVAERAAAARGGSYIRNLTLWKNSAVASVKHCSILALVVLCSPLTGELSADTIARRGAEERDVCHG